MDTTPLISIIVPVYNVEKYLSRCIESILSQSYKNLELILVDDGSTDLSYEICKKYKAEDNRVIITNQKNAGSSVARNTGLSYAKGEFIGFVDSDDWVLPNMFDVMISKALKHKLNIVECALITSKDFKHPQQNNLSFKIESKQNALARIIKADSFAVWRRIYHSNVIKDIKFIPGKIHQDVFYTLDAIENIENIGVTSSKLYVYNNENESIIRSAYNLKKLEAKDAVFYVNKICSKYSNINLQEIGNLYVIKGLLSHYISLFTHSYLDPLYEHRKKIKSELKIQYRFVRKSWNYQRLRALIAIRSPFWLYNLLITINKKRIQYKLQLKKKLNV